MVTRYCHFLTNDYFCNMKHKSLEEMTLEELWELFPIELVPFNHNWESQAREEICLLDNLLDPFNPVINHIGSTAIPGICAKPIVDILIEVPATEDWNIIANILKTNGYILMNRAPHRMSFNKGYTIGGYADNVFHIHVHETGDNDEILFRDFLRSHPDTAREYETLKLSLLPAFRHDRDGYTAAKTQFVTDVLSRAKSSGNGI